MSNTYKDRPRWVRSNDPRERRTADHAIVNHDHCTIDEPLTRETTWSWRRCSYDVVDGPWGDGPGPDDIHDAWWGPQRVIERDSCRRLAAQYNTTGTIDDADVPAPEQHRHGASWHWW